MCGIVSAIGQEHVTEFLLNGLRRLEYRGYDSAGVAVISPAGECQRLRAAGKVAELEKLISDDIVGDTGIAHTRWATHGPATTSNAHPHTAGRVHIVHNGIIENYQQLKTGLLADGFNFSSDTDTEVVAALIEQGLRHGKTPRQSVIDTINQITGAFALAILIQGDTNTVFGARRGAPLLAGYSEGIGYLASDSLALAGYAQKLIYLEDGDLVEVTREGVEVFGTDGKTIARPVHPGVPSSTLVDKGTYRHFMLKEIHEQPEVIAHTISAYVDPVARRIKDRPEMAVDKIRRLIILGCGTASFAGNVAEYWIERLARLSVKVELASEFRYRQPHLEAGDAALFISQSGETADTLEALKLCKAAGIPTFALVNTLQSTIAREADVALPTVAGAEIGVASTKAFTCQLTALACLTVMIAKAKGAIDEEQESSFVDEILGLPRLISDSLLVEGQIADMASNLAGRSTVLYLGREQHFPIALEGALKLKEVSYIHAEGYAAGELKHGPIALIEPGVAVITIAPDNALFPKTASSIEQVGARGADVIAITDGPGRQKLTADKLEVIEMPVASAFGSVFTATIAVQLLAYYVSVEKGTDVDQPRNLAKSVTVE